MRKNTFKIQNIKMVKTLKGIVQNIRHNSYYLYCRQTSIATIHLRFLGSVSVSAVLLYITVDECTSQCSF
jgi:hypothetical protein